VHGLPSMVKVVVPAPYPRLPQPSRVARIAESQQVPQPHGTHAAALLRLPGDAQRHQQRIVAGRQTGFEPRIESPMPAA